MIYWGVSSKWGLQPCNLRDSHKEKWEGELHWFRKSLEVHFSYLVIWKLRFSHFRVKWHYTPRHIIQKCPTPRAVPNSVTGCQASVEILDNICIINFLQRRRPFFVCHVISILCQDSRITPYKLQKSFNKISSRPVFVVPYHLNPAFLPWKSMITSSHQGIPLNL